DLGGDVAVQDLLLERNVADQERSLERLEAADSYGVERPRSADPQLRVPSLYVPDKTRLIPRIVRSPVALDLDLQCPARDLHDGLGERQGVGDAAFSVGQREDGCLRDRAARLVHAPRPACGRSCPERGG